MATVRRLPCAELAPSPRRPRNAHSADVRAPPARADPRVCPYAHEHVRCPHLDDAASWTMPALHIRTASVPGPLGSRKESCFESKPHQDAPCGHANPKQPKGDQKPACDLDLNRPGMSGDRGVPVDGLRGFGDPLVDAAQGATGAVVAVLVVDDTIRDAAGLLAGGGRPGLVKTCPSGMSWPGWAAALSASTSSRAKPRCSIWREPRRVDHTICTAFAPEAVFTVRT